jgi:hypothetical protein
MASRQWIGLAVLAHMACGGSTAEPVNPTDGGGHDAQEDSAPGDDVSDAAVTDASGDAGYLACMSATGQLDDTLKSCQSDTDCVIKQEQTDCCGTILYVGVSTASAGMFDTCEAAWVTHFPACGCASNQTKTEDGKTSVLGGDAGAPKVHCTDFTMSGGICMTYTP